MHTNPVSIERTPLGVPLLHIDPMQRLAQFGCILAWVMQSGTYGFCDEQISFSRHIAPVLVEHCVACHSAKKAEGGYRLDTYVEMRKPGDSGASVLRDPITAHRELLRRVQSEDPSERMPAESESLSISNIQLISDWIKQGATFDGDRESDAIQMVAPPKTYPPAPLIYAHPVPISAMSFDVSGDRLFVSGYREVIVWQWQTAKLYQRVSNVANRIYSIQQLPQLHAIAVGCGEPGICGEVRLYESDTGVLSRVLARASDVVLGIALRAGTNEAAVASADNLIRIVDLKSGENIRSLTSHADIVTAVAYSDDGTKLASASRDKSAKVYDASSGDQITSYAGHATPVRGLVISQDGKEVLSSGADNKVHRWTIEDSKKTAEYSSIGESFHLVKSATHVFVPATDGQVRQFRFIDNGLEKTLVGSDGWIVSMAMHPNNEVIAAGYAHGEVRIWNINTGELMQNWIAAPRAGE